VNLEETSDALEEMVGEREQRTMSVASFLSVQVRISRA
jgi:hypothetical protein